MIDEDSKADPKALVHSDRFEDAMLYDFSKFLTTLAILALGGVLTVTATSGKDAIKPIIAVVIVFISMAGLFSVSAAAKLSGTNVGDAKGISAKTMLRISLVLLGAGSGGFLVLWWNAV